MMCAIKVFKLSVPSRVRAAKQLGRKHIPKTNRILSKNTSRMWKLQLKSQAGNVLILGNSEYSHMRMSAFISQVTDSG